MKKFYCNSKKGICCKMLCNSCKFFDRTGGYYIDDKTPQLQTNFDKITSSIDVFVEFLDKHTDFCTVDRCKECSHEFICKDCIKEWLEQECEK